MKKILSILLIMLLIIPNAYSQPLRYSEDEDDWSLEGQNIEWEPILIEKTIGDLKLKVWIMHRLVPAPEPGYLMRKSDWIEIRRMLDSLDDEISRVKNKERAECDLRIEEKNDSCKRINANLLKTSDQQKIDLGLKDKQIELLNKENKWIKIVSGALVGGLTVLTIYQAVK